MNANEYLDNILRNAPIFDFSEDELPIRIYYQRRREWDQTYFVPDPKLSRFINMRTAAMACQLVIPMLYENARRADIPTLNDMSVILEHTVLGGARWVIENLDIDFYRTRWPIFIESFMTTIQTEGGTIIVERESQENMGAMVLASYACYLFLEHVIAMQQNLDGSILYLNIAGWEFTDYRTTIISRILYSNESLILSIVYSIMALAMYYEGVEIVSPNESQYPPRRLEFFDPEQNFSETWPIPDWYIGREIPPNIRIIFPHADQFNESNILDKWTKIWWNYVQQKLPMMRPFSEPPFYVETPEPPEKGPWQLPSDYPLIILEPENDDEVY